MFQRWSILVVIHLLCLVTVFAQSSSELTDQQKVMSWQGEKVILVGKPFDGQYYHPYLKPLRRPQDRLVYDQYVGKTGVIIDAKCERFVCPKLVVRLDASNEEISVESPADNDVAFLSEMDIARKMVEEIKSRPLWTKGKLQPYERETEESVKSNKSTGFEVGPLSKLTVYQVEWAKRSYQPIHHKIC